MIAFDMVQYGQLPAVRIHSADGAEAIVTLYGAHLVSWRAAGVERLFCSARSALDGSKAIRGGVPVIFPQFAERGDGMRHGFARVSHWRAVDQGDGYATFELKESDLLSAHAAAWPHAFILTLTVALKDASTTAANQPALELTLTVTNRSDSTFAFSSALHSYFAVPELADTRVGGLAEGELAMNDHIDRIVSQVSGPLTITGSGQGALRLEQSGFQDVVIWNPGAADAAALSDMQADEYRRFMCVEAALIEPLSLAPGAVWQGEHRITVTG